MLVRYPLKTYTLLILLVCMSASLIAQEKQDSKSQTPLRKPGQVLHYSFHEIPKTLYSMHKQDPSPAMMTVRLPDNYNEHDSFPLLVFLRGGNGSDCKSIGEHRITEGKDYVVAVMPLFQIDILDKRKANGLMVEHHDYPVMIPAYGAMIRKLKEEIPNLRYEGSTLGGFSNGAHTIAILLDFSHPEVMQTFENFFMVDGGFYLSELKNIKGKNLLLLFGGKEQGGLTTARRSHSNRIADAAEAEGVHFESQEMKGVGHAFPSEQYPVIYEWMQRVSTKP